VGSGASTPAYCVPLKALSHKAKGHRVAVKEAVLVVGERSTPKRKSRFGTQVQSVLKVTLRPIGGKLKCLWRPRVHLFTKKLTD